MASFPHPLNLSFHRYNPQPSLRVPFLPGSSPSRSRRMNMRRWTSWVTSTVFFFGNPISAKFLDCTVPASSAEHCSDLLANITVVESGEFIIAKLQCYGCPTTARHEKGGHEITHEENALVCNPTIPGSHQIVFCLFLIFTYNPIL